MQQQKLTHLKGHFNRMSIQRYARSALRKIKKTLYPSATMTDINSSEKPLSRKEEIEEIMRRERLRLNATHAHEIPPGSKRVLELVKTPQNTRYLGANWLLDFQNNLQSEHGEDGIIAKIFEIMPPTNKWVCEFGAHDPENISNTWRLINEDGWSAVLIEADPGYYNKLSSYYAKKSDKVICLNQMVSYEGEDRLDISLAKTPIPVDLDFMVIDIDGNDYHVWEAIQTYCAKVVMIEFNAAIPHELSFVQNRDMSLNQGTSLYSMTTLAAQKGYKLIATTSWNAFFVKEEYYSLFFKEEPHLNDMYVYPAKHPINMRVFQLYDGRLIYATWNEMMWHKIDIKSDDNQVLPKSYQVFSRELAASDFIFEQDGTISSASAANQVYIDAISQKPGNPLAKYMQNTYSRYGEDGMLEKLLTLLPQQNKYLVEIGAIDDPAFSKSKRLLEQGYTGFLFEDNAVNDFETRMSAGILPKDFDLLIINIYGMEYQVWESIKQYSPAIVAIQFNPTIPNDIKFIQDSDFKIHQGCSLRALYGLAEQKGYKLAGVTMETAFFVRSDCFNQVKESLKLEYNDLDDIFAPILMRVFQLYDGTIALQGLDRLLWHGLRIDVEKLQVVPKALRKFHQYAEARTKSHFYRI